MADGDRAAVSGPARAGTRQGRGLFASPLLAAAALLFIALFASLGTWQVARLQWKLDLIARVQARVHAAPEAPPAIARWNAVPARAARAGEFEYRRLRLSGTYLYDLTTPVQALTEEGAGYWLVTPLCLADGGIVLVNRGFIPAELGQRTRYDARRASGEPCRAAGPPVTIVGLLRMSEEGGAFTRANDPAANRWFSRHVAAIGAARGVAAAPYFVDAAAGQNPPDSPDQPRGGMTVVRFHNSHLMYAITWYALASMVAGAWWWVARNGPQRTSAGTDEHDD